MRFINLESGNTVSTDNPITIKLMQASPSYQAVDDTANKKAANPKKK